MLQTEGHKQYNLQDAHKHEYELSDANEDDIKIKLILTQPAFQFGQSHTTSAWALLKSSAVTLMAGGDNTSLPAETFIWNTAFWVWATYMPHKTAGDQHHRQRKLQLGGMLHRWNNYTDRWRFFGCVTHTTNYHLLLFE